MRNTVNPFITQLIHSTVVSKSCLSNFLSEYENIFCHKETTLLDVMI